MDSITITLPLPDPCLSPNSRKHWRTKAKAKKAGRVEAYIHAHSAVYMASPVAGIALTPQWQHATEQTTFYHKQKRRRDGDNHLAMLKAYFDGIVDAGILADDEAGVLTHLPIIFKIDKENPRVEIRITRQD